MNRNARILLLLSLFALPGTEASAAPEKKAGTITPVPFNEVTLTGGFWADRMRTELDVTVPFSVSQCGPAVERFRRCAAYMRGEETELPEPHRFISSDLYKVMEGVAYSLMARRDAKLEAFMDETIGLIGASQQADGYLYISHICHNPSIPDMGDRPYSLLNYSHELYNVGHLYEAAVAYYQATGKRSLLDIAIRNARHVNRVFFEGDPDYNGGKPVMQAPGHEEIELALCKLYRVTGDGLYLEMAKRFLDIRGVTFRPDGEGVLAPSYAQQHLPVAEQMEPVGHAVRAAYLYTAMAQVDALTGRNDYERALRSIWTNLVSTRMHITGGLGAVAGMEGFGAEYELPNKTAYDETCAAVGNVFFNQGMFLSSGKAEYLDVAEVSIFNNALAGISLSGDRFFYVNPLEADNEYRFNHGAGGRVPWFGCACCPPNISRMILQIPGYMYAYDNSRLYLTLYGSSRTSVPMEDSAVGIEQRSGYPFDGRVRVELTPEKAMRFGLCMRIPTWCSQGQFMPGGLYTYQDTTDKEIEVRVNGRTAEYRMENGFAVIDRKWKKGDVVELNLPMPVRRVRCDGRVEENVGTSAVTRGPLVYCAEEADNGTVQQLQLGKGQADVRTVSEGVLQGIPRIDLPGSRTGEDMAESDVTVRFIPYYAWCNRGDNQSMRIWIPNRGEHRAAERTEETIADRIASVQASSAAEGTPPATVCDGKAARRSDEDNIQKWVSRIEDRTPRIEISFDRPVELSAISVFWVCGRKVELPESWSVSCLTEGVWRPMELYITDSYQTQPNRFNVVHPAAAPLRCEAVRIVMTPRAERTVGISEIRFD